MKNIKLSSPEPLGHFQPNVSEVKGTQDLTNKEHSILKKEIVFLLSESTLQYNHNFAQLYFMNATVSQVKDGAHWSRVLVTNDGANTELFAKACLMNGTGHQVSYVPMGLLF